ncbi:LOW QUALITY PROTEIN: glycolipid transfer protein domain-containing protein 2 [Hypomesus transpacificus]|uniref:LOW QUALITY PROTEIN: glycolipid transfer protein domain-containing protein 2 n=1 Tax=Hypomesus transpacificus TaxID=137520 RepID=UPI001F0748CB|nr:LOW QUALITY PROTEIN: glycolipid transfer protein domain-containing protein 2 [Hypomesus transpacificus]
MGVKGKAALAILVLLLFLGSMWLQGSLDRHWESCLKSYNHFDNDPPLSNSSDVSVLGGEGEVALVVCPGQVFQVSLLLASLLASPASPSDVLLEPYLASWDELIKFMESLGPMVGLISQEIQTKTSIIRHLALEEEEKKGADGPTGAGALPSYSSVRLMIQAELARGLVDFQHYSESGCRTLLRLHRALLWLQLFLEKLAAPRSAGRLRSPSELCREAYQSTLAKHHTWLVRKAAELAFIAMPERGFFYRLVCVQNQEEASAVLHRVVRAIGVVYERTQAALEEHGMLDLP